MQMSTNSRTPSDSCCTVRGKDAATGCSGALKVGYIKGDSQNFSNLDTYVSWFEGQTTNAQLQIFFFHSNISWFPCINTYILVSECCIFIAQVPVVSFFMAQYTTVFGSEKIGHSSFMPFIFKLCIADL